MAGTNTEKPTGKAEKMKTAPVANKAKTKPVQPKVKKETKTEETKTQKPVSEKVTEEKAPTKKEQTKPVEKKKAPKKEEVTVSAKNLPVSTKVATAICKFINNKDVVVAMNELDMVTKLKKAVPMKGEIPHRKGKIMSGRFPQRAALNFMHLLKNLHSNAIQHDVENPIIKLAIANKGTTTYAKGGRARKKRSNITIVARQKKEKKNLKEKKK